MDPPDKDLRGAFAIAEDMVPPMSPATRESAMPPTPAPTPCPYESQLGSLASPSSPSMMMGDAAFLPLNASMTRVISSSSLGESPPSTPPTYSTMIPPRALRQISNSSQGSSGTASPVRSVRRTKPISINSSRQQPCTPMNTPLVTAGGTTPTQRRPHSSSWGGSNWSSVGQLVYTGIGPTSGSSETSSNSSPRGSKRFSSPNKLRERKPSQSQQVPAFLERESLSPEVSPRRSSSVIPPTPPTTPIPLPYAKRSSSVDDYLLNNEVVVEHPPSTLQEAAVKLAMEASRQRRRGRTKRAADFSRGQIHAPRPQSAQATVLEATRCANQLSHSPVLTGSDAWVAAAAAAAAAAPSGPVQPLFSPKTWAKVMAATGGKRGGSRRLIKIVRMGKRDKKKLKRKKKGKKKKLSSTETDVYPPIPWGVTCADPTVPPTPTCTPAPIVPSSRARRTVRSPDLVPPTPTPTPALEAQPNLTRAVHSPDIVPPTPTPTPALETQPHTSQQQVGRWASPDLTPPTPTPTPALEAQQPRTVRSPDLVPPTPTPTPAPDAQQMNCPPDNVPAWPPAGAPLSPLIEHPLQKISGILNVGEEEERHSKVAPQTANSPSSEMQAGQEPSPQATGLEPTLKQGDKVDEAAAAGIRHVKGTVQYCVKTKKGEDRIVVRPDLGEFLRKGGFKFEKGLRPPEEIIAAGVTAGTTLKHRVSLFGVFDGHNGYVAAVFCKNALPFFIAAQPAFAEGDYATAIKMGVLAMHISLRDWCPGLQPEDEMLSNTASGATASVVIVAKGESHFGILGDSPLYYVPKSNVRGDTLHKQGILREIVPVQTWFDSEHRTRLMASQFPLMVDSVTQLQRRDPKRETLDETRALRPGFSGVEPAGSVGDTIYDASVFNALLDILDRYKLERFEADTAEVAAQFTLSTTGKEFLQWVMQDFARTQRAWKIFYFAFKAYAEAQEEYKYVKRHFVLDAAHNADSHQISFLTYYLCTDEEGQKEQRLAGPESVMCRTPSVVSLQNDEMHLFLVASDGVLCEPLSMDQHCHAMSKMKPRAYDEMLNYFRKNPDNIYDDQTCLIAHFD